MADFGASEAAGVLATYGGKLAECGKQVYRAFVVAKLLRFLPVPLDADVLFEDSRDDLYCLMNSTEIAGGSLSALVDLLCTNHADNLEQAVSALVFVNRSALAGRVRPEVESHNCDCGLACIGEQLLSDDGRKLYAMSSISTLSDRGVLVTDGNNKGTYYDYDSVLDEVIGFNISYYGAPSFWNTTFARGSEMSREDIRALAVGRGVAVEGDTLLSMLGLNSRVPTYASPGQHFRLDKAWLKSCVSVEGAKITLSQRNTAALVVGIRVLRRSGLSAVLDSFIDELESVVVPDAVLKFERRDEIPAVFAANAGVWRPRSVALPGFRPSRLQVYSSGGYRVVSIPGINRRVVVPLGLEGGMQYLSPLHDNELLIVSFLKMLKMRNLLPIRTVRAVCRRANASLDFFASPIGEYLLRTLPGSRPFLLRKVLRTCKLPEDDCVSVLVWLGAMFQPGDGPDYGGLPRVLESAGGFSVRKTQLTVVPDCPVRLDAAAATRDEIHGLCLPLRRGGKPIGFLKLEPSLAPVGMWRAGFVEDSSTRHTRDTVQAVATPSILVG